MKNVSKKENTSSQRFFFYCQPVSCEKEDKSNIMFVCFYFNEKTSSNMNIIYSRLDVFKIHICSFSEASHNSTFYIIFQLFRKTTFVGAETHIKDHNGHDHDHNHHCHYHCHRHHYQQRWINVLGVFLHHQLKSIIIDGCLYWLCGFRRIFFPKTVNGPSLKGEAGFVGEEGDGKSKPQLCIFQFLFLISVCLW